MYWWIPILMVIYLTLYLVVPKGILLHEVLQIPFYWMRHIMTPKGPMKERRVNYGEHRHQYYLFFEPRETEETKNTIIIYFHGGCWRFGRPWNFRVNASFFVKRGYRVVLPSHRRPPRFKYDQIKTDIDNMLISVCQLAQEEKMDNFNILLGGMSSGGHLATMMLYDHQVLRSIGLSEKVYSGLFICATPLNLNLLRDHFVLRDFAGPRAGELFQIANPMNYVTQKVKVPILCFHGKKDGMVPFESILPFIKELEGSEVELTFHPIEDGNHMSATQWVYYGGEERKLLDDWLKNLGNPLS